MNPLQTQSTCHIMMVRPAAFGYNAETAKTNAFQSIPEATLNAAALAQTEFDAMVAALRTKGVNVVVIADTPTPIKPDAVFPNNWVSFHATGEVYTYPMESSNRQTERRMDIVQQISEEFDVESITDLSGTEAEGRYLEGTGSIIFDHTAKKAYACTSRRTHPELLEALCERIGYTDVIFESVDARGQAIYHTNVMMAIGPEYAVICLDSIPNAEQRQAVQASLEADGKTIVNITLDQVTEYAGNMLAVRSQDNQPLLCMSASARASLTQAQVATLEQYTQLLAFDIPTIETIGGGSVRCMMAEIFLPERG